MRVACLPGYCRKKQCAEGPHTTRPRGSIGARAGSDTASDLALALALRCDGSYFSSVAKQTCSNKQTCGCLAVSHARDHLLITAGSCQGWSDALAAPGIEKLDQLLPCAPRSTRVWTLDSATPGIALCMPQSPYFEHSVPLRRNRVRTLVPVG